jgi:hypothetical protein
MAMLKSENTSPRPRRRTSLLLAIAATTLLLTVGVATAAGTSPIEGAWSFSGGKIVIQPEPGGGGDLEGVVVAPTTFAKCVHPAGQVIWKEMKPQADGSYQGFHQWYDATESTSPTECTLNTVLGPTAWRVVEEPATKAHYLRVCLSSPGTTQPSIPPGSTGENATYGCLDSEFIAPPSEIGSTSGGNTPGGSTPGGSTPGGSTTGQGGAEAFKEVLTIPSNKQCLSGRAFKIHLQEPKLDPFSTVVVTLKGKKLKTVHKGNFIVATINLKRFPAGKFTIKIVATTVLGHHLSGTRTYHTCAKKPKKSKPKSLKST